jgi:hypothetical protein
VIAREVRRGPPGTLRKEKIRKMRMGVHPLSNMLAGPER